MKEIKFIVSEEDTEILKAIMDCDPRFDTEETMTVVTLEPIKNLLKEQREIIIELKSLRDKFPNQGIEVYELQPNTEQWKVLGQAEVMLEVEKIINKYKKQYEKLK
jgi:hypothetical protein